MVGKAHNVENHALAPSVKNGSFINAQTCNAHFVLIKQSTFGKMEVTKPVVTVNLNKRCCVCNTRTVRLVGRPSRLLLGIIKPTNWICVTHFSYNRTLLLVQPVRDTQKRFVYLFFLQSTRFACDKVKSWDVIGCIEPLL
jgi:hypothetical protein